MLWVRSCKLFRALCPLLLVLLMAEYTEPSYSFKSTNNDIMSRLKSIGHSGTIEFQEGLDLLKDFQSIIDHEKPEKRLEIFQASYDDLVSGSPRGYVSGVMEDFLVNATAQFNDTKELTRMVKHATDLIEAKQAEAFPPQPGFFARLFGAKQPIGPYDNYGLGVDDLFGNPQSSSKTQKDNTNSGSTNANNSPNSAATKPNPTDSTAKKEDESQDAQTNTQSGGGLSSLIDGISGFANLFTGGKKAEGQTPKQPSNSDSQNSASSSGDRTEQSGETGIPETTTTTTAAPEKSGWQKAADFFSLFG